MDNRGFIKIHRKLLKWEWYQDINTKVLFLHLLLSANWEDRRWQGQVIKRGQFVSTAGRMAKDLGLSLQQARTALKKLVATNEVTCQATNRYTLYTVVNYGSYQDINRESNRQDNIQSDYQVTGKQHPEIEYLENKLAESGQEVTDSLTCKTEAEYIGILDIYGDKQQAGNIQNNTQITDCQQSDNKPVTTTKEDKEVKNTPPIVPQRETQIEFEGDVGGGDFLSASFSPTYSEVLDCWKDERSKAGLSTGMIGKNSKTGAMKLAAAIDRGEATLMDARKAIRNLLADPEKRETYSLSGLVNNFEIWLNRSPPESESTTQLNQTREIVYYSGVCGECNYSVTGFGKGVVPCVRCGSKIELRREV